MEEPCNLRLNRILQIKLNLTEDFPKCILKYFLKVILRKLKKIVEKG